MANTSRTMASRKRPPPNSTTSSSAAAAAAAATAASAQTNGANGAPASPALILGGIDALLAKYARHLPPGGTISVQLIKGPSTESVDPLAARKAAAKAAKAKEASGGNGNDDSDNAATGGGAGGSGSGSGGSNKNDITQPLSFPRVAKFVETVAAPDFKKGFLKDGKLFEEEVPKAKDESDEDEATAYSQSNAEGAGDADPNNPAGPMKAKKKKRRWRRNDPRPRRWVLQDRAEFVEHLRKRKQRSQGGGDDDEEQGLSDQYNGVAESNASKYVMLSVAPTTSAVPQECTTRNRAAAERISVRTIHGFHTFSQPHRTASLSMEEAENALEQQRSVVTRYMMHGKMSAASQGAGGDAKAAGLGVSGVGRGRGRSMGPAPKAMSRARLLGKLAGGGGGGGGGRGGDEGDDDDVMGDVRFSSSGGSSRGSGGARRELLNSLGEDLKADGDGVLGGANDSEFGGRQRFANVAQDKDADGDSNKKKDKGGESKSTSTGFEAGAMEEGFYQRDVAAEYEALDYDANEQFDNEDVNMGEDEMMDDGGGYGGGDYDSDDDDGMGDSDGDDEDDVSDDGMRGMASRSGLKAMLAKARGESPVLPNADASNGTVLPGLDGAPDAKSEGEKNKPGSPGGGKGLESMKDAEEKGKKKPTPASAAADSKKPAVDDVPQVDKDGKRLITLEAVRREIWLNNGAITSKRLMKKFEVSKKQKERQGVFKQIVMELCTVKQSAEGTKLVLKQHYSKI